jgi:hypothetical protein
VRVVTAVRITKLEPDPRGFWTANVTAEGVTVRVDNSLGSWTHTTDPKDDPGSRRVPRREVRTPIAKRLADRLRRALRGEEPAAEDDVEIEVIVGGGSRARTKRNDKPDPKAIAARMARAARNTVEDEEAA